MRKHLTSDRFGVVGQLRKLSHQPRIAYRVYGIRYCPPPCQLNSSRCMHYTHFCSNVIDQCLLVFSSNACRQVKSFYDTRGVRGEVSVPVERAFKECKSNFITIPVDEFRSTAVSNIDDTLLIGVRSKHTNSKVRGLLWNGSSTNKFLNRDLNGALNIRRCITNPTRPLSLVRSDKLLVIPKRCGKVIKY